MKMHSFFKTWMLFVRSFVRSFVRLLIDFEVDMKVNDSGYRCNVCQQIYLSSTRLAMLSINNL